MSNETDIPVEGGSVEQAQKRERLDYDTSGLVVDIAIGEKTQKQMAEAYGLSEHYVGQIVRGQRRPELQEMIKAARESFIDQARLLAAHASKRAIQNLSDIAADKDSDKETRIKACREIILHTLGDPSKPVTNNNITQTNSQSMPGLNNDDLENIGKMKGGPQE